MIVTVTSVLNSDDWMSCGVQYYVVHILMSTLDSHSCRNHHCALWHPLNGTAPSLYGQGLLTDTQVTLWQDLLGFHIEGQHICTGCVRAVSYGMPIHGRIPSTECWVGGKHFGQCEWTL